MIEIACAACGKNVEKLKRNQRYCSKTCDVVGWRHENRAYRNAYMRTYNKERRKAARKPIVCEGCGTSFTPTNAHRKHCSRKCNNKMYAKNNRAAVNQYRNNYAGRAKRHTPWTFILMSTKARAKKRTLPFELDHEWCRQNWTNRCAISDIEFEISNGKRNLFSPSIDQIIPGQGYTKNNSRFVLWAVNGFKGTGDDATLIKIAAAITAKHSQPVEAFLALPA